MADNLEWVTNTAADPVRASSFMLVTGASQADVLAAEMKWRSKFVIGKPKATDAHSAETLERYGMVGMYWPPTATPEEDNV
jgi:hypothetical protein